MKKKTLNLPNGFYKITVEDSAFGNYVNVIEIRDSFDGGRKIHPCVASNCKRISSCETYRHVKKSSKDHRYFVFKNYGALSDNPDKFIDKDFCHLRDDFFDNKVWIAKRKIEPISEDEIALYVLQTKE